MAVSRRREGISSRFRLGFCVKYWTMNPKAVTEHPLEWLLEPLVADLRYLRRKMFGCEAAYLDGRIVLVLAVGDEPWNGVLLPTSREHHESLFHEWPQLRKHSVLGKWLYLSQTDPDFETIARVLVKHAKLGDPRIGVLPKPRKSRKLQGNG